MRQVLIILSLLMGLSVPNISMALPSGSSCKALLAKGSSDFKKGFTHFVEWLEIPSVVQDFNQRPIRFTITALSAWWLSEAIVATAKEFDPNNPPTLEDVAEFGAEGLQLIFPPQSPEQGLAQSYSDQHMEVARVEVLRLLGELEALRAKPNLTEGEKLILAQHDARIELIRSQYPSLFVDLTR